MGIQITQPEKESDLRKELEELKRQVEELKKADPPAEVPPLTERVKNLFKWRA